MARRGILRTLAVTAGLALLAACGGAGFNGPGATLRFVNATSAWPSLDLYVDGQRLFAAVAYGQGDRYASVDPDRAATQVRSAGASAALVSTTPALTRGRAYTLIAWGGEGAAKSLLVDDEEAADAAAAKVRVVNAAGDAGALEVFLLAPGETVATGSPSHTSLAAGNASGYATRAAGTWRLRVIAAGDRNDPRLQAELPLAAGQVATLVLTPTTGGALVNALWLVHKGPVTALATSQARVRLAAPQTGTVSATVGGVPMAVSESTPVLGAYVIVPAGAQPVSGNLDGVPLGWPSVQPDVVLAPGTDQTLLVRRLAGSVSATWVLDDNRAPTADGKAKVRLLNGLDLPLSMTVDLLPVVTGQAAAAASPYALVDGGSSRRVTVTDTGTGQTRVDLSGQALDTGRVYTVFPVEGAPPSAGIVRRDR